MAVFHLREDESVAAGAVLHTVLLALWGNRDGQHIGQVGEGQGQQAAHVKVKRGKGMGEERRKKVPPHLGELAREWGQFLLSLFLYFSVPECSASVFFLCSQSNSCCSSLCFITFTCPLLADPPFCCCIQKSFSSPVRSPDVLCEGWIQKHTHTQEKRQLFPIVTPTPGQPAHAAQPRKPTADFPPTIYLSFEKLLSSMPSTQAPGVHTLVWMREGRRVKRGLLQDVGWSGKALKAVKREREPCTSPHTPLEHIISQPPFPLLLSPSLLRYSCLQGGLEEEAAKITHSSPQEPKTRNSLWKPFAPSHSFFPSLHFLCLFNLKPFYWHVNYYLVKNMFTWNYTKFDYVKFLSFD